MAALLTDHARQAPDRTAVVDERGSCTWEELDERVDRLVAALRARGLEEGDVVALLAGNQRESIEVALACLHGGWLVVPINWHWVADEVAHVLADAGAAALVVAGPWIGVAQGALDQAGVDVRVRVATADEPPVGFEAYEAVLAGADIAQAGDAVRGGPMFYTSGTTGHPKGVRGGLAQTGGPAEVLQFVAAGIGEIIGTHDGCVQLVCGPIYHSAQWVFCFMPLLRGATVVLQHKFDAAGALALIDEHGVTNTHLVPAQFVRLLRLPDEVKARFSGSSLRQVHHGAAPCPPEVKRQVLTWLGPIVTEYYGGTEGGFLTAITAEEWLERPESVGRPLPLAEILVVGDDGTRLGPGEVGDLYFRSLVGNDFAYHNAPEKTEAAHLEAGVGTLGDVGWIDDEGYLFLSDRRIDMIVSGGVNIYPAEVERVLAGHPAVADVAVIGVPDDEMGERVLAVVELGEGVVADRALERELDGFARQHLAGYKCPRAWDYVEALPRNEAGKLLKRDLRAPHWAAAGRAI